MDRWKVATWSLFAGLLLGACGADGSQRGPDALGPGSDTRPAGGSSETPPEGVTSSASCIEVYSPETLVQRSFAFDGTVKEVERHESPDEDGLGGPDRVTFDVHTWYAGGEGATAVVQAYAWGVPSSDGMQGGAVGDRLLVSGDDDFAWPCGFTTQHSAAAAAEWAAAF